MAMKRIFKSKLLLLLNGLLLLAIIAVPFVVNSIRSHQAHAAGPELPPGFAKTQLANGLKDPTVLAFAPNGDIYIGEQAGAILIYRNGAIVSPAVITL
ncbi:MAG: hypothetical protein M3Z08_18900, partial [Chloroflexota bacterium]|nr:hypothetical protein [Chloroflexota bacterium]